MSGLGVVHLVYKVQRALPVWCSLYTLSLIELFGSELGETYKSVQKVFKNGVHYRIFPTAW